MGKGLQSVDCGWRTGQIQVPETSGRLRRGAGSALEMLCDPHEELTMQVHSVPGCMQP